MESGYRITNLILLDSNFSRSASHISIDENHTQNIDIEINVDTNGNNLLVTETLNYKQSSNENNQEITAHVKMLGSFEIIGEPSVPPDQFGKINGAAIIFPFIREHLSGLALKAGLGILLLPPVNFTKVQKKKDNLPSSR